MGQFEQSEQFEQFELIVRGGMVVLSNEVRPADIGIRNGKIAAVVDDLTSRSQAAQVYDASGLYIMPGMIDAHVHLNEPALGHWEGFETGSAALAAGGCTTYIDMPLNGVPPTVRLEALEKKLALADGVSAVDFALWGGLVPGNVERLAELAEAGVIGFKAFMSCPGGEGEDIFAEVDELTLYEGMKEIARLGKVLALHAESEPIVSKLAKEAVAAGKRGAMDFVNSRPVLAELEAVNRALFFAELTGCALHFVHISSSEAVELISSAKARGMNVTVETCPHYLTLTLEDVVRLGAVAKCAPPLRSSEEQERLWAAVRAGKIDIIASDHSPCPTSMKDGDMFEAWGGISGAQSSLELMLDEGHVRRGIPLPELSKWLSLNPAKRFGLYPRKGEIAIGMEADLAIIDMGESYTLASSDLLQRHKHSPYIGRSLGCRVKATMVRGNVVYEQKPDGVKLTARTGRWIRYDEGNGGKLYG
ncbi:allantoinase [Paenibacillus hexagrammi]|uniref:Allantoinase n=1 Tax=Paenibacillus hexagrammi TaxID=2908839 RepID=A0ABY3SFN1_9BACL|nr:allantoinase [Paenibacillus sp. YPD9-1]UJF32711.1 allantoinase [Paenibacillus sp. YPD9-1]